MRTTVELDDEVLDRVQRVARETHRTTSDVIEQAVRDSLPHGKPGGERKPVRLPTFSGGGLQPGVDLDDSAGLLDVMEGRDAPS